MSKKRIKSSINRIIGFYYNAIRYRLKYRYSFFKYSLFIPIKFITKTFSKQLKNKNLVHEWKILESEIVMKDGTIFYANNLVFFFEQFHDKIYEELPEFMVKKGMTIIDCGAASGEYTLYALQKGANLIAFEPEKKAFLNLEKNTKKYKNVKLYNLALSNKDTKTTKKMDSIIDTSMKIDILKIDVEGHEIEVLKGARKTLKNVDKIVMEIHTEELFKKCRKILTKEHKISRKDFNNIENAQPLLFAIRK